MIRFVVRDNNFNFVSICTSSIVLARLETVQFFIKELNYQLTLMKSGCCVKLKLIINCLNSFLKIANVKFFKGRTAKHPLTPIGVQTTILLLLPLTLG